VVEEVAETEVPEVVRDTHILTTFEVLATPWLEVDGEFVLDEVDVVVGVGFGSVACPLALPFMPPLTLLVDLVEVVLVFFVVRMLLVRGGTFLVGSLVLAWWWWCLCGVFVVFFGLLEDEEDEEVVEAIGVVEGVEEGTVVRGVRVFTTVDRVVVVSALCLVLLLVRPIGGAAVDEEGRGVRAGVTRA